MKDNSKLIARGKIIQLIKFETLLKESELIPLGGSIYRMSNMEHVFIGETEILKWAKPKTIIRKAHWFGANCVETGPNEGAIWVYPIKWILKTFK